MTILERVGSEAELVGRENHWIDLLGTDVSRGGLNVARGERGGTSSTRVGAKTRAKMSKSAKERYASEPEEVRRKRLAVLKKNGAARPFQGRKHTDESRRKISEAYRLRREAAQDSLNTQSVEEGE